MNEDNLKDKNVEPINYLERKYGKEPKLTEEEIKHPRWH